MSPCGVEIVPTRASEFSALFLISKAKFLEFGVDTRFIVSDIDCANARVKTAL